MGDLGGGYRLHISRKSQSVVQERRKVICPQTHFTDPNRDILYFDDSNSENYRRTSLTRE